MEYPHNHHHHHHREEEVYPPPPRPHPPPFYENEPPPPPPPVVHPHPHPYEPPPPPPPQVTHVYHSSSYVEVEGGPGPGGPYPPPPYVGHDYRHEPPPPPPPVVECVSHHSDHPHMPSFSHHHDHEPAPPPPPPVVEHVSHHSHHPHMPSFFHHHDHHPEIANKPSVRVYSKAETNYSLTIRDGKVVLAPSNPSDPFQHWIKDEKYSTKVKDEEGFPSFALVNKATGQAMKHSVGATKPVHLIPYNSNVLDESILWTLSKDLGDTYRTIRMVNNIRLNVDAFNGDKNHGGVHDGTIIVLWEWKKGENQRWKIVPYCKFLMF